MQALATEPHSDAGVDALTWAFDRKSFLLLRNLARAALTVTSRGYLWFPSVLMLPVLYQLAFKQTLFVPTENGTQRLSLIPVWGPIWYTAVWLLFTGIVATVFLARGGVRPRGSNLLMRRVAVLGVGLLFTVELAARLASRHMPGGVAPNPLTQAALAVGLAAVVALVAARPPRCSILVVLLFAGGLALRLFGLATTASDPELADNLPAIAAALDRLSQGASPYGFYSFAQHSTSMAYLPLTILAYLPAHIAGLDIRLTNIVLSLSEAAALLLILHALRVPEPARSGLSLAVAVNYVLPLNLGHDLHNEFQMFDLSLVIGLGLVVTSRFRPAAVLLGVALGAMPTGLFCAAAVLGYAVRRITRRELWCLLLVVASIATVPLLYFFTKDPSAFIQVVSYEAGDQWGHVAGALDASWPYAPVWYGMGDSLKLAQLGLFTALTAVAAVRVRSAAGAAQLAAMSYLLMLLTGPQSGSHILAVVVPLVLIAEAARLSRPAAKPAQAATVHEPIAVPAVAGSARIARTPRPTARRFARPIRRLHNGGPRVPAVSGCGQLSLARSSRAVIMRWPSRIRTALCPGRRRPTRAAPVKPSEP